jgi:leucyl/phenylalanyl-tRNA--protein transferase
LFFEDFHVPRTVAQTMRRGTFELRLDSAFADVIRACATSRRRGQRGTWITKEMERAYLRLHEMGLAHSVEAWKDGALAGGLYGVSLGGAFFGESMFAKVGDASKVAFVALVRQLQSWGFTLLDSQVRTEHVARFGAREIPRTEYAARLREALKLPTRRGDWNWEAG